MNLRNPACLSLGCVENILEQLSHCRIEGMGISNHVSPAWMGMKEVMSCTSKRPDSTSRARAFGA